MSDPAPASLPNYDIGGRIVHISADFPDLIQPTKTRAIETLVRMVDDRFDNQIFSINRTGSLPGTARHWLAGTLAARFRPRLGVLPEPAIGTVVPLRYDAPPMGLFHATLLTQLGDWLAERLAAGPRPALLVGHKLTVEGIAVRRAAALLGVPYALSLQGNTDLKIASSRPDLRGELARCFHDAAMVMPFAPWAMTGLERLLGRRQGPSIVIPCPVADDRVAAPVSGGNGLVTAFHLRHHKLKNLDRMAKAADHVAARHSAGGLAVIGGGLPAEQAECEAIARRHPALRLEGPLPLAAMPGRLNRASGFVLISRRESFGLVFIEALLAGLPIAYPANLAVDGYFDGQPFALRVDNRSVPAMAEAMARLLREEDAMKRSLAEWQASDGMARFRRTAIADAFAGALAAAATSGAAR